MNKILSGVLVVVAMVTFNVSPVYAGGHTGSNCSKCAHKESKCKVKKLKKEMAMYWAYQDELKMTEDQLMQIADIKHAAMKTMLQQTTDAKIVKVDIKTELWAPQIDADKVMPLIDAKYAAKANLAKTYVQALADAQAVLTDGQRQELKTIKTDRYIKDNNIRGDQCSGNYCPMSKKS